MKKYTRQLLLIGAFIVFPLLIFFYFTHANNKNQISQNSVLQTQTKISPRLPVRLTIPVINVDANIQHIGVTPKGAMEVPNNTVDVGWFKLGSRPGEKGSAVISGHFDGANGAAGVFTNLHKLKKGDSLYIKDDKGTVTTFIVRESRTYDPGYAEEVFSPNDNAHLNLVTCDGVWDGVKKSYSKRLVIFTDATQL